MVASAVLVAVTHTGRAEGVLSEAVGDAPVSHGGGVSPDPDPGTVPGGSLLPLAGTHLWRTERLVGVVTVHLAPVVHRLLTSPGSSGHTPAWLNTISSLRSSGLCSFVRTSVSSSVLRRLGSS